MFRRVFVLFLILQLLYSGSLIAGWKKEKELLDQVYIENEFRFFYTLRGKHQLPAKYQQDLNHNKIPDYVEFLARRLNIAHQVYQQLGFVSPLKNRYKGKAKSIDIHLLKLGNKGTAGDSVVYFRYRHFPRLSQPALSIKLSNNLSRTTLTPVHELFHLYQYGYTLFKNRWFTEGTARWAEYIFKKGTGSRENLPKNQSQLQKIMAKTYGAKVFWRRLAYLLDHNRGRFVLPNIKNHKKLKGFSKLIEDNRIYGYPFIRTFLEFLERYDKIASSDYQLGSEHWPEQQQKSASNNIYLLCALKQTIAEQKKAYQFKRRHHRREILEFEQLLAQLTSGKKQCAWLKRQM